MFDPRYVHGHTAVFDLSFSSALEDFNISVAGVSDGIPKPNWCLHSKFFFESSQRGICVQRPITPSGACQTILLITVKEKHLIAKCCFDSDGLTLCLTLMTDVSEASLTIYVESWKNMPIIANIASLPLASSALSFFFRSSGSAMPAFLGCMPCCWGNAGNLKWPRINIPSLKLTVRTCHQATPKGNDRLPTIHFQVLRVVSGSCNSCAFWVCLQIGATQNPSASLSWWHFWYLVPVHHFWITL